MSKTELADLYERIDQPVIVATYGELPAIIKEMTEILSRVIDEKVAKELRSRLALYKQAYLKAIKLERADRECLSLVAGLVISIISTVVYGVYLVV